MCAYLDRPHFVGAISLFCNNLTAVIKFYASKKKELCVCLADTHFLQARIRFLAVHTCRLHDEYSAEAGILYVLRQFIRTQSRCCVSL